MKADSSTAPQPSAAPPAVLWPLAAFLVFTAVATSAGYVFFERLKQSDKSVAASALTSIGKLKAEQIRSYVQQEQNSALSIGQLLGQGAVADWLSAAPSDMPARLQELLLTVMRNGGNSGLLILDANANPRFGAGQYTNLNAEGRELALRAMTSRAPVTSDIYWGDPSAPEQAMLDFFVPIQRPDSARAAGVLVLRDDLAYLYRLIQTWPVDSQTGESVLVRLEGDHVLFLNELRFRKRTALRMQVPLSASRDFPGWPSTAAARGQTGVWEAYDYLNDDVLAYTLPVSARPGWGMIVKVDLAEVFAPTQRLRNVTIGVTAVFVLLALLSLGTWLGLLQRQHDREMAERRRMRELNEQLEQRVRERTAELEQASLASRESEERFRASAHRYRSLFDNMLEGFAYCQMLFDHDRPHDFVYLEVNTAFEALTGLKNVVGRKVSEVIPGIRESNPELFEIYGRVAMTGKPDRFETYVEPLERWFSVSVYSPEKEHFVAVFDNITERKQAEETMRALNADLERRIEERTSELRTTNDTLADFKAGLDQHSIVAITDSRGKITYVNDKFCEIARYAREELLGQDHRIINSGHHPKAFIRDLWQTIGSGRVWKGEIRNRAKDGTFYWVATTIVPFLDAHGTPVQYIAIRTDITERKQAEEHISELNADLQVRAAQLAEANKELESFSYSVSHDLRAPLRHVQGYVEMLQRATEGQLSEKAQRYMKTITEAGAEMGQLIDDLLAFSRMARTEMSESHVDVGALVQDAIRGLDRVTRERTIVWQTAPLPAVLGDPALLKLVLANLVDNAVKYSRMRDPARIEIGCAGEEDGRLILFVRDNGAGFDMQYAHKLFGVFQRLHRVDEFEGTGIGLATVRRIVDRHGGRVWAEGAVNQGATFYFTLKRSPSSV